MNSTTEFQSGPAVPFSISLRSPERVIQSATLNTLIALVLTLWNEFDFGTNLLYSQCIGLSIWGLIGVLCDWLMRDLQRHWRRLFWIVPVGSVVGYVVGTAAGDAISGRHRLPPWDALLQDREYGFLILSLGVSIACTYYFMSQTRLAAAREEAASASAQTETAQRQMTESQLKLLQTQLEPHMLFNTLANLRALIGTNPVAATDMLDRLNNYLRATLSASRVTAHPLQTEFDRLNDYLELIAVRMGPRLQFSLHLPPTLAQVPVPPLLLQPVVENAIKHGLEPKVEGGRITVLAHRMAGQIMLDVQDTGVGLPPGGAALESFGLTQVRERLANTYGERGKLELMPTEPSGTLVRISYPNQT